MGITFTGSFTKFSLTAPPVNAPPTPNVQEGVIFHLPFAGNTEEATGVLYTTETTGTPSFAAATNAPNAGGIQVINFDRHADNLIYTTDLSALANDFTIQFWVRIVASQGTSGDAVFDIAGGTGGIRLYMRAASTVGNSQGNFQLVYRDAQGDFNTNNVTLDVNNWNYLTLCKKGNNWMYAKNGGGAPDTFTRTNGSTAVVGGSGAGLANAPNANAAAYSGAKLRFGGATGTSAAFSMADFQILDRSLMDPADDGYSYLTTPYHADRFF